MGMPEVDNHPLNTPKSRIVLLARISTTIKAHRVFRYSFPYALCDDGKYAI